MCLGKNNLLQEECMPNSILRMLSLLSAFLFITSFISAQDKPPAGFEKVDLKIDLGTIHGDIRFNKEELVVKPGQKIKIVFKNSDEMPHNMLILKPGSSTKAMGELAMKMGAAGLEAGYIPKSDKILWHIPMTMPGKTGVLYFQAPKEKGVYPYVCTIPGHFLKMIGKLYVGVQPKKKPKKAKEIEIVIKDKPYVYRSGVDIPGVGKRAFSIAVGLPGGMNFIFDAESCQLTAAWKGKFLDARKDWDGRGGNGARIMGDLFYTNKDHKTIYFPIKGGGKPVFRGYRMYKGNPVFICYVGPNKMTIQFREEKGKLVQKISVWNTQYVTYLAKPKAKITAGGQKLVNGEFTKPARPSDGMLIFEVEIEP